AVRLIVEREREIQNFKPEEFWKVTAVLSPEGTVPVPGTPVQAKVKLAKKPSGEDNGKAEEPEAIQVPDGTLAAELAEGGGQKFKADNEDEGRKVATALESAAYVVAKVEQKDRQERPQPPFITSTLQQQANIRLRFSASRTMQIAQQLYQGVELGKEGSVAL